jgi:hypothetical protein
MIGAAKDWDAVSALLWLPKAHSDEAYMGSVQVDRPVPKCHHVRSAKMDTLAHISNEHIHGRSMVTAWDSELQDLL